MNNLGILRFYRDNFVIVDAWLMPFLTKMQLNYDVNTGSVTIWSKRGYRYLKLHRIINCTPKNLLTDHKNRYRQDCRGDNLISVNKGINNHNRRKQGGSSSRFFGVTRDRSKHKWMAQCKFEGKHIFIGRFLTEIEAAKAYNIKIKELYGESAHINVI